MGIEPTTVLPATCFQDKLLVHSAAFQILSNMSMNSFIKLQLLSYVTKFNLKKKPESFFILIRASYEVYML